MNTSLYTIVLISFLITLCSAQNCRFTAPSQTKCKVVPLQNCTSGSTVWPYPRETCKFQILVQDFQPFLDLSLMGSCIRWEITNLDDKVLANGTRTLNVRDLKLNSKGFNLFLTFPSEINLFTSNFAWKMK
jgi:hypothetical protein